MVPVLRETICHLPFIWFEQQFDIEQQLIDFALLHIFMEYVRLLLKKGDLLISQYLSHPN